MQALGGRGETHQTVPEESLSASGLLQEYELEKQDPWSQAPLPGKVLGLIPKRDVL